MIVCILFHFPVNLMMTSVIPTHKNVPISVLTIVIKVRVCQPVTSSKVKEVEMIMAQVINKNKLIVPY